MIRLIVLLVLCSGVCLLVNNGFSQNLSKADSLIEVVNKKNLSDEVRLKCLVEISYNHPNPDSCLKYANEALEYVEGAEYENYYLTEIYLHLGYAYKLKGQLNDALHVLLLSLKYANKHDNESLNGIVYNAIAGVYRIQNNYVSSLNYYNKAEEIFRNLNDQKRLAKILLNKGEIGRFLNDYESAKSYFIEARDIFEDIDYVMGVAYSVGNLGMVYSKTRQEDMALVNLVLAVKMLRGFGDVYPITVYQLALSDLFKNKGDFDTAILYADSSFNAAKANDLKEQIRDACKSLGELYRETGKYKEAYSYQNQYKLYKDSVVNKDIIEDMAVMQTEYEVAQKQAKLDLLRSENKSRELLSIFLCLGLVLISAIAYTYHRNTKKRRDTSILLGEQKEEISAQRDQLDELNKTKDRFFSIISHDLRGPVHSFKGLSRLIRMYIDNLELLQLKEINKDFESSVDQLTYMLDDLLDWALTQGGKSIYQPERVELAKISTDLLSLFVNMARAKNITLVSHIAKNTFVWADYNCVNTILRNLINNALKFTEDGGIIAISAKRDNKEVAISVADNGIGMSAEKLKVLFKLAEGGRSWGTDGEKGLGLGLQLVHQFTELNGGRVKVESKEQEGSVFTVFLPAFSAETLY